MLQRQYLITCSSNKHRRFLLHGGTPVLFCHRDKILLTTLFF